MSHEIKNRVFPDEETFQKIYEECCEREPGTSDAVKSSYKKLSYLFDEYLGAIQEHKFRYAYQCGYEAAMAEVKKGGAV